MDNARILKELKEIQSDTKSGVEVTLLNGSVRHMVGTIQGEHPLPRRAGHTLLLLVRRNKKPICANSAKPALPPARRAGPSGSPYEGGTYNIDIVLPDAYPFEPPKMKFLTKVWRAAPSASQPRAQTCGAGASRPLRLRRPLLRPQGRTSV